MKENRKSDVCIEFFRIIGCLIVIAVHLHLDCMIDGMPDKSRILITCLCCDGVGIYWFICGAFLFGNQSYKRLLKHMWHKIIIPMVIFSVFVFYMRGFILQSLPVKESITHSFEDYKAILMGILGWYNPVEGIGHLWYLYVYILVMLAFPILKGIVTEIDKNKRYERVALILILLLFFVNDITNNVTLEFSHHSIRAMVPASMIIITGHIVYKYHEYWDGKWWYSILALILFMILNIIRTDIVYYKYLHDGDNTILVWYSLIGVLGVLCLFVFTRGLENIVLKFKPVIQYLGKQTFIIYLVHRLFIEKYNGLGINSRLYQSCMAIQKGALGEFLYTALFTVFVFVSSLLVAAIINEIGILWSKCIVGRGRRNGD